LNGGAGPLIVNAAAAAAGARIIGGAGGVTLTITGGGAAALNTADIGLSVITLQASSSAFNFTANAEAGLTINDLNTGADTIAAGGTLETVTGGGAGRLTMIASATGGDTFRNAAALFNGDSINGFASSNNVIDVTNVSASKVTATFVENAAGTAGQLNLSDGTHSASITLFGQFMAAGFSGSAAAAGFTATSDGSSGTDISYAAVIAKPHPAPHNLF